MVALPLPHAPTVDAIYASYEKSEPTAAREYLGASVMGNECDRALWYAFRWANGPDGGEKFSGRMLRLFKTGHREEDRMLGDLERAGITVHRVDPATGRQWAVSAVMGHFRGHMDGMGEGFAEAPKTMHVLEFKTHNDKSYRDVVSKGVEASKPAHYAQVQIYMHLSGLQRAFYLAHNKNTDELHQERIAYDATFASRVMARAERIIMADEPPQKLHENPEHKMAWHCRFCPWLETCHTPVSPPPRSCRTCLSSTPVDGGFHCNRLNQTNDIYMQRIGCSLHLNIPALVPGDQTDVDVDHGTVTYAMNDGSTWVDGSNTELAGPGTPPAGGGGPLTDEPETDDAEPAPNAVNVKSSEPAENSTGGVKS